MSNHENHLQPFLREVIHAVESAKYLSFLYLCFCLCGYRPWDLQMVKYPLYCAVEAYELGYHLYYWTQSPTGYFVDDVAQPVKL
jgi:hypothetical protein